MLHAPSAFSMPSPRRLCLLGAALACSLALLPAQDAQANKVDEQLRKQTSTIFGAIEAAKYKNVGVLPFQVQVGDKAPSMHLGDLNKLMATRVGNMLILKNKLDNPIGIIPDAGAQAGKQDKHSTWRTDAGRAKMFNYKFSLPWQQQGQPSQVNADAFLTGLVKTNKEFKTTTVTVFLFDKKNTSLRTIAEYTVPTERSTLMDMNVSFKVEIRDLNRPDDDNTTIVPGPNTGGGGNGNGNQGKSVSDYLDLKVFYGDKEVPITNNSLPKPDADVKVMFKMTNIWKDKKRLGVVLLVNGINTVASTEKVPDREAESCSRWVLEPGKLYGVYGFHEDTKTVKFFVAKPPDKAVAGEDFVEAEKFKIQVLVFLESESSNDTASADLQMRTEVRSLLKGTQKVSLAELKKRLQSNLKSERRNIIGMGESGQLTIETTTFKGRKGPSMTLDYSGGSTGN